MTGCKIEFNGHIILLAVRNANNVALRRAGAYIRKAARNSITNSQDASAPGTSPHSRNGLLKRSILFGLDKQRQSVVIGPSEQIIGNAMAAHEFGGTFRKRRYPKRPLMGPTLTKAVPKLPTLWDKSVTM